MLCAREGEVGFRPDRSVCLEKLLSLDIKLLPFENNEGVSWRDGVKHELEIVLVPELSVRNKI